jgi:hypothetical protein
MTTHSVLFQNDVSIEKIRISTSYIKRTLQYILKTKDLLPDPTFFPVQFPEHDTKLKAKSNRTKNAKQVKDMGSSGTVSLKNSQSVVDQVHG